MRTELIFAEVGPGARPVDREHFLRFFPGADISVTTETKGIGDRNHPRWAWRANDYLKANGMLESKAGVAIAFDADMRIVSEEVSRIEDLAIAFGLCLPANPRRIVHVDNTVGADGQAEINRSAGLTHAVNCGIMAMNTGDKRARECVRAFLDIMRCTPMRGPVAWAKAFFVTGFSPCLLPAQWCVCAEDVGIGNEIVLHVGHQKVREHYANIL